MVAESYGIVVGWASLNRYSHRCAYDGVADLSIYVDRTFRSKGVGSAFHSELEKEAKKNNFYKIVLFTFPFNENGQRLYRKIGYREVGVFEKQGVNGRPIYRRNDYGKIALNHKDSKSPPLKRSCYLFFNHPSLIQLL
ncbi:hypothetical protein HPL003_03575 [Paenibacillus terrae HPL-003]|uniref:N-acetyltransferase domain-containing protein n=1 Tax=Paenibacillus terrae (strain HPL-003) TaxID=985665 RepID=G7VT74_PAETH|nr:GNAT family N-acetyltransferase [Paenibacillus terrae]AET57489.1 hypothetical protein HPL003_03575 [Paenibacillus terrae HPL-003]